MTHVKTTAATCAAAAAEGVSLPPALCPRPLSLGPPAPAAASAEGHRAAEGEGGRLPGELHAPPPYGTWADGADGRPLPQPGQGDEVAAPRGSDQSSQDATEPRGGAPAR